MVQSKYPWSKYGLSWNPQKKIPVSRIVLYISMIAVLNVLGYMSVIIMGPLSYAGISFFFFVMPFIMMFSMWWGLWGMIGAYIANVIGAGILVGSGLVPALVGSVADFVVPLIVFIIYRGFLSKRGLDPFLRDLVYDHIGDYKTKRVQAWIWFIFLVVVIYGILAAELGVYPLYVLGFVPPSAYWIFWYGYIVGNVVATILLVPIIVKGLSAIVERQGLLNEGWIT